MWTEYKGFVASVEWQSRELGKTHGRMDTSRAIGLIFGD
jgi:hypothetical protein